MQKLASRNIKANAASEIVFGAARIWAHVTNRGTVVVGLRGIADTKEVAKRFGLPEDAVSLSDAAHQAIAVPEGTTAFTVKASALLRTAEKSTLRAK